MRRTGASLVVDAQGIPLAVTVTGDESYCRHTADMHHARSTCSIAQRFSFGGMP
jgi:hypothetical protein